LEEFELFDLFPNFFVDEFIADASQWAKTLKKQSEGERFC